MSRRFVSVCILALAGIMSFAAGHMGSSGPRAFPSALHLRTFELAANSRSGDGAQLGPYTHASWTTARTALRCARGQKCAAAVPLAMTFEPNVGQFDPRVKYVGRGAGMTVLLTPSGIDVAVADASGSARGPGIDVVKLRAGWAELGHGRIGDRASFAWRGEQWVRAISNYFIGRNPRGWSTNVPHFARAAGGSESTDRMGIEVYGTSGGVEYDLRLPPGAKASRLRLRFSGAQRVYLEGGDVILSAGGRTLRMAKPRIYAELSGGARRILRGGYVMEEDGSVGLNVGPHDSRAMLVVDPTLSVAYTTFLSGAGNEASGNVAVDASGKVYVSGATASESTFPEASGAAIGPVLGASAFYVAKIDPTTTGANSLVYLTFLGGSGTQTGGLIAVDSTGNVALTGTTSSTDYPVTGSSQPTSGLTSGDGNDAVVSEINAAGNQLNFSAYFGGSGRLSVNGTGGIAIDQAGDVYIASDAEPSAADPSSPDLPVVATAGAAEPYQPNWDGEQSDRYLAVFAPPAQSGGAATLAYCTYLGTYSAAQTLVGGVAVDADGNAYVAGSTSDPSYGFPLKNAFQNAYAGGTSDGFVMKIAPTGQGAADLVYATMFGGSGMDEILAIGLDSSLAPKAYVTGETQSPNFPLTVSAYQTRLTANPLINGSANAFVAVIAQDPVAGQTSLACSSYLGGSDTDEGLSIAVTAAGSVYVAGETNSPDFPWRNNLQAFNGSADAFLAKFDPTSPGAASFIYATPLAGTSSPGGSASASASGVAANGTGKCAERGKRPAPISPRRSRRVALPRVAFNRSVVVAGRSMEMHSSWLFPRMILPSDQACTSARAAQSLDHQPWEISSAFQSQSWTAGNRCLRYRM